MHLKMRDNRAQQSGSVLATRESKFKDGGRILVFINALTNARTIWDRLLNFDNFCEFFNHVLS